MRIKISNYRAIRADNPLIIELSDGLTFLLGRNNVGKSSVLRLFSELRPIFSVPNLDMRKKSHAVVQLGTFWDGIVNRDFLDAPIILSFQTEYGDWEYSLKPNGARHTKEVLAEFNPTRYANDNDIARRTGRELVNSIYFGPVRSTTYSAHSIVFNASTGSNFITTWAEWATGDNIQHQRAAEQLEEEIRSLFGFTKFKLIVNKDKNELKASYDEGTFNPSELGEGLSNFIIVLANAMVAQPNYIFLDEPENGLHPRLQAKFVQTLASKCKNAVVASSHSLALARSVADQVLYCTKEPGKGLQIIDHTKFELHAAVSELREMSYSQLIETGEQNLLLVEGRTDVKAFRELLRLYGIEQRYIIVSLGGAEFIAGDATNYTEELKELRAIGAKSVSVVIDSEISHAGAGLSKTRESFVAVCKSLGFEVLVTDRRALENYVTQEALTAVFGGDKKVLGPFEVFGSSTGWKKSLNWRIFQVMKPEDLKDTNLGQFLAGHLTTKSRL